ncbi:hypothetical protein BKA63DRAFT_570770 [Paraphoma chrysanthemicola]|nr:hypothetical protein BKA63DRAFT_570770 [Paraphoma chrysanthemicola]
MDISSIVNDTSFNPKSSNDDKQALFAAIDAANLNRVRAVLREICSESPEAYRLASEKLLVKVDGFKSPENGNGDSSGGMTGGVNGGTTGTKRKAQNRYDTCIQCEQEYDVLENHDKACVWHEGETEPDYDGDFWADHDERIHGIIDSEESREEYPEGFVWDCCQKRGMRRDVWLGGIGLQRRG